jgi:hypothetical protein
LDIGLARSPFRHEEEDALQDQDYALLKTVLETKFLADLPPLLPTNQPPAEQAKKNLSRAFSAFAVASICHVSSSSASQAVVDDYEDYGIDAIFYQASTETLYLVQGKFRKSEMFDQDDTLPFCQGVKKLLRQDFDNFNKHVTDRQAEIEAVLEACSKIELVVAHIGNGISQHAKDALTAFLSEEEAEDDRLQSNFIDFDSTSVLSALHISQAFTRIDTLLKVQQCKKVSEPKVTYFGLVKVSDLTALHRQHGPALYERNIRTFLGHKTDVNIAIRKTLAEEPEMFMYLNNGVTMLAEMIETKGSQGGGSRLRLRGVSVINGAQTIATSAQYQEEAAGNDISAARVFLTIIEAAAAGDFGKSITRARNHQNQVVLANFAALDDEQERLRRELAPFGIHYAYKADAPDNTHNPLRIRIEEAAQALAMFQPDPRFAIWVRKEPMTLLDTESSRYRSIFHQGLKGLKLANAVRLNRYIQTRMTNESRRGPLRDRLIYRYGNFAIAWVMAKQLVQAVEGGMLLDEVKIEATLSKPFDDTRQMLADATNKCIRGPLAVFRNQGEAIPVVKDLSIASYGLTADPVIAYKAAQSVKGEAYPKDLFDYTISKAPQIGGLA